jgi:hypothetical protein
VDGNEVGAEVVREGEVIGADPTAAPADHCVVDNNQPRPAKGQQAMPVPPPAKPAAQASFLRPPKILRREFNQCYWPHQSLPCLPRLHSPR